MALLTCLAMNAGCQLGAQLGLPQGPWLSLSVLLCEVNWVSFCIIAEFQERMFQKAKAEAVAL